MKIAVVQHRLRPAPAQDLEALLLAAANAVASGAEALFLPEIAALSEGPLRDELSRRADDEIPVPLLVPLAEPDQGGDPAAFLEHDALGVVAILSDDACMDADVLAQTAEREPDVLVLLPGSESELQAEAVLELAIALSTSVAALVLIVEPYGADLGVAGHGGSAVVHLGEMLAEATEGDALLLVDVATPIGPPEPRGPLPLMPPLLAGRVAAHAGRKLTVDYPADLG